MALCQDTITASYSSKFSDKSANVRKWDGKVTDLPLGDFLSLPAPKLSFRLAYLTFTAYE